MSQAKLAYDRMQLKIARLKLEALQEPTKTKSAKLQIAKLELRYAEQEYEKSSRLYAAGSISKLSHRRAKYRRHYAQIIVKAASGEYSVDSANLLIANNQLELAKIELQLAKKLFVRRSISRANYEQMQDRVAEAQHKKQQLELKLQKNQESINSRIGT